MPGKLKHYIILNLTVFVWGFTGVIGEKITLNADAIVFFRMGIAFLSVLIFGLFYRSTIKVSRKQVLALLLTGAIVGAHWFAFFHSAKVSKVAVAVVCMSAATLFTAILEPIFFKRKMLVSEFVLSFFIVFGIALIIGFEPHYIYGIIIGLISALLASLFSVLNGKLIKTIPAFEITKYEMLGGFLTIAAALSISGKMNAGVFNVSGSDWIYLLILGIICTTVAFAISVWLMKFLSPFTVSMSLNMEPIYAIAILFFIDLFTGEDQQKMTIGFYGGTAIILGSIFLNAYLKRKKSML